jgi:hypothetical protein
MRRIYCVVLLASAFLVSCGNDEGFTAAPIPSAQLIVFNAIPASPDLNLEANNQRTGTISFAESTNSTAVLPQIALDFRVSFFNNRVEQTVLTDQFTLDIDFTQILILTGSLDSATAVKVVEPPFTYADGSTDTRIRFMNASSNVASATLTLTNPNGTDATVAMTNGQPTGFATVTSGAGVQMEIRDTSSNALLWRSGDFTLSAGADRFFIMTDYFGPGGGTVRMSSINDPSGIAIFQNEEIPSAVRFINQTANQGQLDFLVDGALAASLNFGEVSDYVEFPESAVIVTVTPAGDAATELNSIESPLFRGAFASIHAAVSVTDETLVGTSFYGEDRRPVETVAIINVTKLAPVTPLVDVYFQDEGEGLSGGADLASLADFTSGPLSVPPNTYDLYVTEAGTTNILIGPQAITVDSRGIYTIQIVEAAGGGEPIQLALLDDFQN